MKTLLTVVLAILFLFPFNFSNSQISTNNPVTYFPPNYTVDLKKGEIDNRKGPDVTWKFGGPDDFGYTWRDSDDPGGPIFNYLNISSTGTEVIGFTDDNFIGPLPIGFTFGYYGIDYTEFYISSNGFIGFGPTDSYSRYQNDPIPNTSDPNNIIAWLWDDLYPLGDSRVFYKNYSDKIVIQFVQYSRFGMYNERVNAEVILYKDSRILLQYLNFSSGWPLSDATVGIENLTGTDGLNVVFNSQYLRNNLAIEFSIDSTKGSISGIKWNDLNSNGIKDEGETPISNWKIKISGDLVDSAYTNSIGKYFFRNLPAGNYTISEEIRPDWNQTYPPSPGTYTITLDSAQHVIDLNFGNKAIADPNLFTYGGEFSGSKYYISNHQKTWHEAKADCEANGGYLVTISSAEENNFLSSFVGYENVFIGFTDEGSEGNWYWITGEPVTFTGWDWGEPGGGTYENVAVRYYYGVWHDYPASSYFRYILKVPQNRSKISGINWNDTNNNGIKDDGEPGLANWKIKFSGPTNGSALTDENGNFTLYIFMPGIYTISEEKQSNWAQTYPPAFGTYSIEIVENIDTSGFNFGNRWAPANISVSPLSLQANLVTDDSTTQTLTISNTGGSDLNYEIIIKNVSAQTVSIKKYSSNLNKLDNLTLKALDGITQTAEKTIDGTIIKTFSDIELAKFKINLRNYYQQTKEILESQNIHLPKIAIVGSGTYDMFYGILSNPSLVQKYLFYDVYYYDSYSMIENYDGLIICEWDYDITSSEALSLNTYYNSGKPIIMGMDDLDDNFNYYPDTKALITEAFGILDAFDGDYYWGTVNTNNPIVKDISQVYSFCCDNDWYILNGADWIFAGSDTKYYGISYEGRARTVLMGENLAYIWWVGNGQLIENAIDWMMHGLNWLSVNPNGGVIFPNSSMDINVSFNATSLINGDYYSNILIKNTDPDQDTIIIPTHLHIIPPEIDVFPLYIDANLFSGDSTCKIINVTNTGQGKLIFNIKSRYTSVSTKWYSDVLKSIPNVELKKGEDDFRKGPEITWESGGPDEFGYTWIDSNDPNGPVFNYIDISSTGTVVRGFRDDNVIGPLPLGFAFNYYGVNYTEFYISSNGFIGFGPTDSYSRYHNNPIPNASAPNNIIAWLWDDLIPRSDSRVYYQNYSDKTVIQFVQYSRYNMLNERVNAEIILYRDGRILLQYLNFSSGWPLSDATVGIENLTGTDGLNVVFNSQYLHNNLGIMFANGVSWIRNNPTNGIVLANSNIAVNTTIDATDLNDGIYNANIIVSSNDPDEDTVIVSATLNVIGAPNIFINPSTILFDSTFVGLNRSDSLIIQNTGVQTLIVNNISLSGGPFGVNSSSLTLEPGMKQKLIITFTPTDSGVFNGQLSFYSNDPSDSIITIPISGVAIHPPVIGVNPNSFTFTLAEGDSTSSVLTISNTGLGELQYDIENEFIFPPPTTKKQYDASLLKNEKVADPYKKFENIPIPEDIHISEEFTTESTNPQAQRLFGVRGRYIYELNIQNGNVIRSIPLPNNIYNWGDVGLAFSGSRLYLSPSWNMNIHVIDPNTGKILRNYPKPEYNIDGLAFVNGKLYALAPESNTIYEMNPYDGTVLRTITPEVYLGGGLDGCNGRLFATNYGNAIYEISIIDGSVINSFPIYHGAIGIGFCGDRLFISDWGITREYNPNTGEFIRDFTYKWFFALAGASTPWLVENTLSSIVSPGGDQNIDIKVTAKELHAGNFEANIIINSNDPLSSQNSIPVNLNVTGVPDIVLLTDSLDFGDTYMNVGHKDSIIIRNAGTDTLRITNITSNNLVFSASLANAVIPVGGKKGFHVTFVPTTLGETIGILTINSNDPDQSVVTAKVRGVGIAPPPSVSGTWTVGSGGNFATIQAALDSINNCYLNDTLRLILTNQNYDVNQLRLNPAANKPDAPPLIISPAQTLKSNAELLVNKPTINITPIDTLYPVGIYISDAANVQFKNVRIILDSVMIPYWYWDAAIRLEGACPNASFTNVVIDAKQTFAGIEVWGNNSSLDMNSDSLLNMYCGIYATEWTSLTAENSVFIQGEEVGIYLEAYGGEYNISNNIFEGTGRDEAAIMGYAGGKKLIIENNIIKNYEYGGIQIEGFYNDDPYYKSINKRGISPPERKSRTNLKERIRENIQNLKNKIFKDIVEKNKSNKRINTTGTPVSKNLNNESIVSIKNNNIEVYYGNGITLWECYNISNVEITNNIVKAIGYPLNKHNITKSNSKYIYGEEGIALWTESDVNGSVIKIDSNNIMGFYNSISFGSYIDGNINITDNQIVDGGIRVWEAAANNLNIVRNHITDFIESGIWVEGFALYNPLVNGGVNILNNAIIGSDSTDSYVGIYTGWVEANLLKIENNSISGNYEGEGIYSEEFNNSNYWKLNGKENPFQAYKPDKSLSPKERIIQLRTNTKERMAAIKSESREKVKDRIKQRISNKNITSNPISSLKDQPIYSIQNNQINHYGGYGINIGGSNGPVNVVLSNNSIITENEIYGGIYIGWIGDQALNINIEQNNVRKAIDFGIMLESAEIDREGSYIVQSNDIETWSGNGLWLGEIYEPKVVDVKNNLVRAVEPLEMKTKKNAGEISNNKKYAIGEEGITIFNGSEIENCTVNIDSNIVSGYYWAIHPMVWILGDISISHNVLNDGGLIFEEVYGRNLDIENNRITDFYEAGIQGGFYLYDESFSGEVSISNNTLTGSDSTDSYIGMYIWEIIATSLKVEDNIVNGNFPGDGIIVENFYSPEYYLKSNKKSSNKPANVKEHLAQLRKEAGNKKSSDKPKEFKKRQKTSNKGSSLSSTLSISNNNPMLSLQRNTVNSLGDGWLGIAIFYTCGHLLNIDIKNNEINSEYGFETGIYFEGFEGEVAGINIEQNKIRKAWWGGICLDWAEIDWDGYFYARSNDIQTYEGLGMWLGELWVPKNVEVVNNIVKAVEPEEDIIRQKLRRPRLNRKYPLGEEGITIYPYSEENGESIRIDSNTVEGYYYAMHLHGWMPGNMSVNNNLLKDGGINLCEVGVNNFELRNNDITDFYETGVIGWIGLWDESLNGRVDIRNNVITGSDTSDSYIGIYLDEIYTYNLAVEDNIISGNYEGDGLVIWNIYLPEYWVKSNKKVWSCLSPLQVKEKYVTTKKSKLENKFQTHKNRGIKERGRKSINNIKNDSFESKVSIQRNMINTGIYGEFGLYLGWIGERVKDVNISHNIIRGRMEGLIIDGVDISNEGKLTVSNNDIESFEGSGLRIGEVFEPLYVNIENNKVKAVEPVLRQNINPKKSIGYEGLSLFSSSPVENSHVEIDSNYIQNYELGLTVNLEGFTSFNISRNTAINNNIGLSWYSWSWDTTSGVIRNNTFKNNQIGAEVNFENYLKPVDVMYNSFVDNDSVGISINGMGILPIINYNNLNGNTKYSIENLSTVEVDAKFNWWGETTTVEMDAGPYPKNIVAIYDSFDFAEVGFVEYANWLRGPYGPTDGSISGKVFDDLNGDCTIDPNETGLSGWIVKLMPNDQYATTDNDGCYRFDNLHKGTYTISQIIKPHWQRVCPVSPGTIQVILDSGEVASNMNYANQIIPDVKDLSIRVASGIARPGFENTYKIKYESIGTGNVLGASVSFVHPLNTTLIPGSVVPSNFMYDPGTRTVTWGLGNVLPGAIGYMSLRVQIAAPPVVNNGDTLKAIARILPTTGDVNPANNEDIEYNIVQGSFDPNDKLVFPIGEGPNGIVPPNTELSYMIRFQNTGTDTAFNIIIRDTLDSDFDIGSLNLGPASHPFTFAVSGNRELKWTFDNILLPDSNVNEPESHGFVNFKIKPLVNYNGAIVENTASIYFDFNLPVMTNTVRNQFTPKNTYSVNNNWNLISVPLVVEDYRKNVLFPSSISNAFLYNNGYQIKDTLDNGIGYWLKFSSSGSIPMDGISILTDTVSVIKGWNLIGTLSEPILTGNVIPIGTNIRSMFYGYSTHYYTADTLKPCKGYWVKVDTAGKLMLSTSTQVKDPIISKISKDFYEELSKLNFEDKNGNRQILYISEKNENEYLLDYFEMPPVPPIGAFDVRFNSQRNLEFVESEKTGEFPITVMSSYYPLIVNMDIISKSIYAYLIIDGKEYQLTTDSKIKIENGDQVIILKIKNQGELPREYALEQNYPNPFNPSTTIRYALPMNSKVTLKIFDILGQEVATLVDEIQEAGYKSINWNSLNKFNMLVSSGIYFYRLEAIDVKSQNMKFNGVKKLIILK